MCIRDRTKWGNRKKYLLLKSNRHWKHVGKILVIHLVHLLKEKYRFLVRSDYKWVIESYVSLMSEGVFFIGLCSVFCPCLSQRRTSSSSRFFHKFSTFPLVSHFFSEKIIISGSVTKLNILYSLSSWKQLLQGGNYVCYVPSKLSREIFGRSYTEVVRPMSFCWQSSV